MFFDILLFLYSQQSRRRSFDLRPLIEPHVRISRIRLSDGVVPSRGVRSTFSSHQPPTGCFITQSISVIGAASFSRIYLCQSPTRIGQPFHPLGDFAKAGPLRIIGVLSSQLLPAFTGTDIIATMRPSDFSYRIIPAFPSGWLYLPYLTPTGMRTIRDLPRSLYTPHLSTRPIFNPTLKYRA